MTIKQCISVFIILAAITPAYANDPNFQNVNEQKLIAVLKSGAPLYDKTQACQKLAVFGSKKSVPALAGLLGDKALGDYARIALEPMKHPGVDEAFRSAAGKLKGRLLAGVITSIGVRRDAKAIATLKSLASDKNNTIARSALFALGRIASDESVAAVMQTLDKGRAELRTDAADAALAAARIMLDAKQTEASAKIYDTVGKSAVPAYVQTAAVYGALVARGVKGLPQLAQLL
ncbi:MAG: HEAT repeat domain-containing protein, partial [Phycisphaerae bacterium]|nr:HEAT repeat domain-containing protein [Phycisphaerae bacterium]